MTPPIGLLTGFAGVLILLALAAAVASPKVSPLGRAVVATLVFGCAWLTTAVADALQASDVTMFIGGAVIVVSAVAMVVSLHLWTQESDGGQGGPGDPHERGGGGPRCDRPDAPHHGGDGGDFGWWPEFEHEFALYVAGRERPHTTRRRPVGKLPG